jgi:hypothetical protein
MPGFPGKRRKLHAETTDSSGKSRTIKLSDVGFMLSSTQIPLDDLNYNDLPPTGQPGSKFTPLPNFDRVYDPFGGSFSGPTAPEPSSFVLMAGCAGLLVAFRLRRLRRRETSG